MGVAIKELLGHLLMAWEWTASPCACRLTCSAWATTDRTALPCGQDHGSSLSGVSTCLLEKAVEEETKKPEQLLQQTTHDSDPKKRFLAMTKNQIVLFKSCVEKIKNIDFLSELDI